MFRSLKPYQLGIDIGAAVFLGLIATWVEVYGPMEVGGQQPIASLAVTLAMTVALAVRRWSPGLALAIAWVGAIVQMLAGMNPRFSDIAIFAVLYVTAAYGSRLVFWLGFASSLVGALVIALYLTLGSYLGNGGVTWSSIPTALAVLVAAGFALLLAWTTGALVRTAVRARETRRAQERAELDAATEHERGRIARDMHDVVAHSLAVVIAQADGARYAAASDPAVAGQALETIGATARSALADVRLLLTQLRQPHSPLPASPSAPRRASGERGPVEFAGPQPTLADLEGLYADVRAAGLDLAVDVDPAPQAEPGAAVQLAVFRILQEALTNALRHGDGTRVDVRLAWHADRVDLEVRNRIGAAVGADGAAGAHGVVGGHGVIGMRERAQLAGGTLVAAVEGEHFVVRARLPIGSVS